MSRKITTVAIATVVAVSFLFVGAGAVAADHGNDQTVGASGHCSDDTQGDNGGGGSVGVSEDGDADDTNASEVESTANGVLWFLQQDDGECGTNNEDEDSYDYVEAHAGPVQFCYSQDNNQDGGEATTDGSSACHN